MTSRRPYVQQVGIKHDNLVITVDGVGRVELTSLYASKERIDGKLIDTVTIKPRTVNGKRVEGMRLDTRPQVAAIMDAENKRRDNIFATRYPGIYELVDALSANSDADQQFTRMMEDESNDGVNPPAYPRLTREQARDKYPIAAAYLTIVKYANSDPSSQTGYERRCAGERAIEMLESGADVVVACNTMVAEYDAAPVDVTN